MASFDYETRTDDRDGELPCPWCGALEGDTWEKSDGTDECDACGGQRVIESVTTRTVYAFRGDRGPTFDLALAKEADEGALAAYLRGRGWSYHRTAGLSNFGTWNPPGSPTTSPDCQPKPGGFWVRDGLPRGDMRLALEIIAKHEGRDENAVLRDIVHGRDINPEED